MEGLSPADSFDEAVADMIADGVNDLRSAVIKFHFEKNETEKVSESQQGKLVWFVFVSGTWSIPTFLK